MPFRHHLPDMKRPASNRPDHVRAPSYLSKSPPVPTPEKGADGKPAGEEQTRALAGGESEEAARKAMDGLVTLIRRYDDPAEPYRSRVAPQFVKEHPGDYAHLARVFEWSTSGDDGDGE